MPSRQDMKVVWYDAFIIIIIIVQYFNLIVLNYNVLTNIIKVSVFNNKFTTFLFMLVFLIECFSRSTVFKRNTTSHSCYTGLRKLIPNT